MALTWVKFEGFEDNNFGIINPAGGVALYSDVKRTGNYSILLWGSTSAFSNRWVLPVPRLPEVFFQYCISRVHTGTNTTINADNLVFIINDSLGVPLITFYDIDTFTYKVYLGNKTTLIGTTTIAIPINPVFLLVEGYIKVHETEGIFKLWLNGTLEINFAGNTKGANQESVAAIAHSNSCRSTSPGVSYSVDDIAIGDDRLYGAGFHKIGTLTQGHYDQWTPVGDVAALDCITPVPPSMDKYIKTTTDGHKQSFGHTGYTPADGIGAVIARHYGQGGGQVTLGRRHNSTDYMEVAPVGLPGVFGVLDQIYFEKPGGGAWDKTTLDATEFIIEAEIPA
jgi:hypothetical protein